MPLDTVSLELDGTFSLNDLALATRRFSDLMSALTAEAGGSNRSVSWNLDNLAFSSVHVTARGSSRAQRRRMSINRALYHIDRATRAFVAVGRAMQTGERIPFSERVREPAEAIAAMLNGRIHSARFENAEEEAIVVPEATHATVEEMITRGLGAIEGRVQTLSNRGGLHFILYDLLNDRAVSCYLQEGAEGMLLDLWDKRVAVEGSITRDIVTGRPLTIRQITRINPLSELFGSYRDALGASPWYLSETRPEQAMRKLRDAG